MVLALVAGGYWFTRSDQAADVPAEAAVDPGAIGDAQAGQMGIRTVAAQAAGAVPVGTVPGVISLPPEARVAVTTPFSGTAVRVLVIQGQQVSAGQPLAVVRAADAVQFGADLSRAQADLRVAQAASNRLDLLAREGVVAAARADEARAQLARTEATIRENRRLLAIGGASSDGTVTLRAPIAGRVASVAIDTGSPVGAGGIAPFVIENDTRLTLDLQVPERLAGLIHPGMAVEVDPGDGSPVTATGTILSIASSLDPATRSVMAKARLASRGGLVAGKAVMVIVSGDPGSGKSGVAVPAQAVTRIEEFDYVFVRRGGRFERRKVTVAAEAGGRSILADGLRAGEQVAVAGVAELKSLLSVQ